MRDALDYQVEIRPVCVNASRWDRTLERSARGRRYLTVRLGLRMVKGLSNEHGAQLVTHRGETPYRNINELWHRAEMPVAALRRRAEAGTFRNPMVGRRGAMWEIDALTNDSAAAVRRDEGQQGTIPRDQRTARAVAVDEGWA